MVDPLLTLQTKSELFRLGFWDWLLGIKHPPEDLQLYVGDFSQWRAGWELGRAYGWALIRQLDKARWDEAARAAMKRRAEQNRPWDE